MGVHLSEDNKIKETRDKGLIVREWWKSSLMIYGIVLFFQVWIIINILSPAIDWLPVKITIFLFWGLTIIESYKV